MDTNGGKIQSFIIKILGGEGFFSKTFSTKPSPERDKKFGRIFGFIAIESDNSRISGFIDYIIDETKEHYSECQRKEVDAFGNFDIEKGFEATVQKTNISIAQYLQTERLSLNLNKTHIFIGVIKDRMLYFTILGDINGFLLHHRPKNEYSLITVYEEQYSHEEEVNPLKVFTQTLSGKVEKQDYLVFHTSNVLDYFSLEKIKNTITENSAQDTQKQFKSMLASVRLPKHFVFSIIMPSALQAVQKKNSQESIPIIDYARAAEHDSMRKLDYAEKATEKLLHPTLVMNIKKITKITKRKFSKYFLFVQDYFLLKKLKINKKNEKDIVKGDNTISAKSRSQKTSPFATRLMNIAKKIFRFLMNFIIFFAKKFFALPLKTKLIAVAIFVLSIFLFNNIVIKTSVNRQKAALEKYQKTIEEVQRMKQQAEEILIYKNEETAKIKLIDAKNKLAAIDAKYQNDIKYKTLKTTIEEKLAELQHSQSINEPIQIGNWKNLDNNAAISPLIVNYGSVIYSQNTNNKFIYKLNIDTRIPSSVYSPLKNVGIFQLGASWGNEILFVNDRQTFYIYNTLNDSLKPLPISLNYGSLIQSIKTFNNKLYVLDANNNQILKFTKRLNGFVNPEEWIRDSSVDIRDAADMAIDGDIYVLKKSGGIKKITLGKSNEFNMRSVDPPLSNPKKIQTKDTMKYLYILDSGNKRIVVIDKDGYIYQQYSSPLFDDLKDFLILEKDKQIYVLNGSIIYGIAMK